MQNSCTAKAKNLWTSTKSAGKSKPRQTGSQEAIKASLTYPLT